MAAKKGQINTFTGGLNMDLDKSLLKEGKYRYAQNIRTITNEGATTGTLTNIESSDIVKLGSDVFASNETIIGTATARDLGIIFTKILVGTDSNNKPIYNNHIYRVDFTSSDIHPVYTNVITNNIDFNIPDNSILSIVCRYEDFDNIKVYWADGYNYIRVINIAPTNDSSNALISTATMFDIVPSAALKRPSVASIGSGRLNAGLIQYCYQLYSPSGAETELSPMGPMIHLTSSDVSDKSIKYLGTGIGDTYGKPTGKSVRIKIDIPTDNQFTRIKLISVYYFNSSEVPVITIVKESDISSELSSGSVYLEDGGIGAVGELTQDEFNLIGGNLFVPKYIESKNNILFAANTTEDTFDIPLTTYDTRVYQFKKDLVHTLITPETTIPGTTIPAYSVPPNPTSNVFSTTSANFAWSQITLVYPYGPVSGGPTPILIGSRLTHVGTNSIDEVFTVISIDDDTITLNSDISPSGWYDYYTPGTTITINDPAIYYPAVTTPDVTTPAVYEDIETYTASLFSSSGIPTEFTPTNLDSVPITHDCIHQEIYTEDRYADLEYIYDTNGNLGGTGINVSYLFANTYFIESYGDFWNKRTPNIIIDGDTDIYTEPWNNDTDKFIDQRTARIGDKKRTISSLLIKDSSGSYQTKGITDLNVPAHDGFLNYSNPYLSNNLASYQRDEIYRFAAVFYDDKGRKSPASWIADIRFPAGYIEEDSWTSNIFEMPSELTEQYASTFLATQELLVKPLGLKFTFKNIPSIVKRIEIVRAKRDINNKTIYAQGTVQKTGTYQPEYQVNHFGNEANIISGGITGALRPHSLMSMGYSYSIAGPVRNAQKISGLGTGSHENGYSWVDYDNNVYYLDNAQSRTDTIYTDHALAPYFYNKNSLVFINPETSYYGVDFVEQLRNISGDMELDLVDLIYPVSTPPLVGMNESTWGSNYYGNSEHVGFQMKPAGTVFPFSMYFGADITTKGYGNDIVANSNSTLCTLGLVGSNWERLSDQSGAYPTYINSGVTPICDIKDSAINITKSEKTDRAFISVGGYLVYSGGLQYCFKNGTGGSADIGNSSEDAALIRIDDALISSRPGFTFKYFNRFSLSGNTSNFIQLIYQLDNTIDNEFDRQYSGLSIKKSDYTDDIFSTGSATTFTKKINSFEYSGTITPGTSVDKLSGSTYISSGQNQYLNWTDPLTTGNEGETASSRNIISPLSKTKSNGPHGDGIVLNFEDSEQLPSILLISQQRKKYNLIDGVSELYTGYQTLDTIGSSALSTFVVNMKVMNSYIYGGSGVLDRQFTEYISTGVSFDNTGTDTTVLTFGGDTFIGIFDYAITRATDPYVSYTGVGDNGELGRGANIANQVKYVGALIPLESSINMHLVNSKAYVSDNYNFAIQSSPGVYSPGANEGSTWKYTQEFPQYAYNSAYSSENSAIGYLSKLLITKDNKNFDCRIWSSQAKTNDEIYDSWSIWKVADYIDVDTQFGEITGLHKFKDKLFFWQKNSFGTVATNERALIKGDNISELTLGTADILSRYDYVTNANGRRKGTIGGIAESEDILYWYDLDNAEMCFYAYQGYRGYQPQSLSKTKGIQTLLNKNKNNITNQVPMVFDKKYNEVLLTLTGLTGADAII